MKPVLEVNELSSSALAPTSFIAMPGSVIGIAGVTGSGRESLLATVFGAQPRRMGEVRVDGSLIGPGRPDLAIRAGLAYLPADRKLLGGIMDLSARENLTLANLRPFWTGLRLRRAKEKRETESWFARLGVRPKSAFERSLLTFSGGNQQKILFGKWLRLHPRVLLLDEPTQGVDVGAKSELHAQLLEAARAGAAVLISSSDADELVAVCDEVWVMRGHRISQRLSGAEISVATLSRAILGKSHHLIETDER